MARDLPIRFASILAVGLLLAGGLAGGLASAERTDGAASPDRPRSHVELPGSPCAQSASAGHCLPPPPPVSCDAPESGNSLVADCDVDSRSTVTARCDRTDCTVTVSGDWRFTADGDSDDGT